MVFRRRFNQSLRPINRIKHVFDEQGGSAAANNQGVLIVNTTDTPTLAATNSVETGSKINGFFIIVEVTNVGTTGIFANVYFILWKNVGGNLTAPAPNTVGANDNKRYVIHQEMLMMQQIHDSNPRTLFKGVIAVPKGMRRCGPNDTWNIQLLSPGVDINYCVQVHYKEFR